MHKVTIFPLGNADTTRIDLSNGTKILIDYANVHCADDGSDRRINLSKELRRDLAEAEQKFYDVVAFTHLDTDHICGSSEFFYLSHANKYQDEERVQIKELWVPAAAILEKGVKKEAQIIRAEARYRLIEGKGIRVFSSPGLLDDWLREQGVDPAERRHLITDAGQLIPGFEIESSGVEFFVHSPFATRSQDGQLLERNRDALALQATLLWNGRETRMHFFSDLTYDVIDDIVRVTEYKAEDDSSRRERLSWDLFHLAHHCSYTALGPEKGDDMTEPTIRVKRLFEEYGNARSRLISTSDPIPLGDSDQPPHRQAAAYYEKVASASGGEFIVTMEHPSKNAPRPIVIEIDGDGARLKKVIATGVSTVGSTRPPRAG